ncbi:hypothetical protein TPENAI_60277 [Tenacibaculum litopenaei]|uniref:hypothetical protein n=1 Tax=Tenacibaculum litopenaei TaxID=396016 RepID=UPI003894AEE4
MGIYLEKIHGIILQPLNDKGYNFVKSRDIYEKKQGDFKHKIHFFSHKRSTETAIEMFVYIEHIPTAKIYKKATSFNFLPSTIGNEIGMIENNDDGKIDNSFYNDIILESEEDIKNASEEIIDLFTNIAEPYFKRYGDLETIDRILNDNPDIISVHRNDQYNRYPLGLIVAKLNNRSNYEELKEKYDILIQEMSEMYIERYKQVKEFLKENYES